jgi:DNA-binding CsgD family transcriptional regulator/uncharacterized protein YkuJ
MQAATRVLIVAEGDKELRRLTRIFEDAAGFELAGLASSADSKPAAYDVRIVQTGRAYQFDHLALVSVPTLYLVSGPTPPARHLGGRSATLPADATPAQIRAAAMALLAGLQIVKPGAPEAIDSETEFAFVEPLTERELLVLNLLADGLSNPQIARQLKISRNTVKFHVSSIIGKLRATSRTDAVMIGVKRGLIIV